MLVTQSVPGRIAALTALAGMMLSTVALAAPPGSPATPVAAPPVASPRKVVVMGLRAEPATKALAVALDHAILQQVRSYHEVVALSHEELTPLLDGERSRKLASCDNDTVCLAEVAASIGAKLLVHGRLVSEGRGVRLRLYAVDTAEGLVTAETTLRSCGGHTQWLALMPDVIDALWGLAPPPAAQDCESGVHELGLFIGSSFLQPIGRDADLSPAALAFGLSYAYYMVPNLALALTVRPVWAQVSDGSADTAVTAAGKRSLWVVPVALGVRCAFASYPVKGYIGLGVGAALIADTSTSLTVEDDVVMRRVSFVGDLYGGFMWMPGTDRFGLTVEAAESLLTASPDALRSKPLLALSLTAGLLLRL